MDRPRKLRIYNRYLIGIFQLNNSYNSIVTWYLLPLVTGTIGTWYHWYLVPLVPHRHKPSYIGFTIHSPTQGANFNECGIIIVSDLSFPCPTNDTMIPVTQIGVHPVPSHPVPSLLPTGYN